MLHRVLCVAGGPLTAFWLLAVSLAAVAAPATAPAAAETASSEAVLAQNADAKAPADAAHPANGQEPAKEPQKIDEYAETQKIVSGPAGNPECVWFGRRVIALLLRDDLDAAFRHLDLYDRFGCPSNHVQAAFRCLVLHGSSIDPKAADSLLGHAHACWINPTMQAAAPATPAPAAAVPSTTTTR
jgi:hypothetical protein